MVGGVVSRLLVVLVAATAVNAGCQMPPSGLFCPLTSQNYTSLCGGAEAANLAGTCQTEYNKVVALPWTAKDGRTWRIDANGASTAAQGLCNNALRDYFCARFFPRCDVGWSTCSEALADSRDLKLCETQCFNAAANCGTPPGFLDCYSNNYTVGNNCTSGFSIPKYSCDTPPSDLSFCTEVGYPTLAVSDPVARKQIWAKQDNWAREVYDGGFKNNLLKKCRDDAKSLLCALMFPKCVNGRPVKTCQSMCSALESVGSCGLFAQFGGYDFGCGNLKVYQFSDPCTSLVAHAAGSMVLPGLLGLVVALASFVLFA
jgi:hypothetical protein